MGSKQFGAVESTAPFDFSLLFDQLPLFVTMQGRLTPWGIWQDVKSALASGASGVLEVTSVVVEDTNAYIGESRCHQGSCSGALQVLSVVDPAHPRPTRTVEVKGYVNKLIADSGRLYVAARAGGLRVIDIADPSSPHEVGAFATASEAWSVSVAPWKAYVATGSGLAVIDISDPTSPQLVGVSTVAPLPMRAVAAESGNLYTVDVLCDAGSCAWNLRAFSQAALPASPAIGSIGGSGMALGVAVADGVAYLATNSTLLAIDLHNPARPSQIAQVATTGPIGTIAASDHYAYAINTDHSDSALQVLDISNPSNPRGVNQTLVPGVAGEMVISGKHLYVAAWAAGLRVFDLSNASAPHEVGVFRAATMARGVDIVQGLAYVADGETGLRIIDVSEPTRLRQVGAYPDRSVWDAHAAAVVGGYAYVAARENGLRVIDISDPSQPSEAGFVYTSKRADRVATQNGYAYVATAQCQYSECSGGVVVIDARDPASPRQTSALDVEGGAFDIQVKGKYLIVASGDAGLQVFDISNPDALLPLARFQTPGKTSRVEMVGDLTFVAAQDAGMLVLRLPLGRP